MTLAITNNNLYQYQNEAGIHFLDRQGSPTINLTITGSTIADPGKFGSRVKAQSKLSSRLCPA